MRLPSVAAASVLLLLVSACSSSEDTADSLTVWVMGDSTDERIEYFDGIEKRYQEDYPDTTINVEFIPWEDAQESLNTAMGGGDAPDVLEVGNDQVGNWAAQGALLELDEHVGDWGAMDDMDQEAVDYGKYEGTQYGIPWYSGVRVLYYRADWFTDLGIEPPQNWEELVDTAGQIESEKDTPGFAAPTDFTNGIASFIWSNGGEIATQEDGEWQGQLTSDKTREAIDFYSGLITEEEVSPETYVGENELTALDDMAAGQLGMYIDGPWAMTQMEEKTDDPELLENISATPIPGPNGDPAPVFAGGSALGVFSTTEHPEKAFELLTLIGDKEGGPGYADVTDFFPAYPEMLDDEKYQQDPATAAASEAMKNTKFFPATPHWNAADQDKKILPGAMLEIAKGEDPDKVLQEANKELTNTLNEQVE